MSQLIENLKSARSSGVPLIAITTQDQPATITAVSEGLDGKDAESARIQWDCINGLRPINEAGRKAITALGDEAKPELASRAVYALKALLKLPPKSIIFFLNGHADLGQPPVVQGIQNLREVFKEDRRTLILLGPAFADMRQELQADIVVLDEANPTDEQLAALITDLHDGASKTLDKAKLPSMVDALRGLPALFTAEQVTAMSFRKDGLSMDALWERKEGAINQTQGLTISRGGKVTFKDLAGMDSIMDFLRRYQKGPRPFRVVLFMDEIEKMMAGAGGEATDSSGVSSDQLGVCLKTMENNRWPGIIGLGVPGSGKTALAEAISGEFGIPKIEMDLGAMKGKYVGDSEGAIRQAFRVVEGIGGQDVLVFATCNMLKKLPPEFRRRFWLGNWYFDVPSVEEQEPIKRIYETKLGLNPKVHGEWPDTSSWTGAEIRNCAELAVRLASPLSKAGAFIVPVATAAPESIDALRDVADGKFLSVSYPGPWQKNRVSLAGSKGKRTIN
jgi:hypothetical protein